MNTTENNKLIAEFLGMINNDGYYANGFHISRELYDLLEYTRHETDLHFNDDWNWLMEVVEKIYNTIENITDEQEAEWSILTRDLRDSFYFPKIEAVYNACVDFIKWYNENRAKEN